MQYSIVKLFWIFAVVASSTFLPAVTINQERVYAQDSPSTTNATVLSGDGVNSQSGISKSIYQLF